MTTCEKAKAEVAVQIVERWIMFRLRKQTFFTLRSLNQAIVFLLDELNQRPFTGQPGTRRLHFEQLDQPVLRPLPEQPYEYTEIKQARVHVDYHIEYRRHYYSVPYHLVKQTVEIQASDRIVAIYYQGIRVACHPRSFRQGSQTTCTEHMPVKHQSMSEWTPERFLRWASRIGTETQMMVGKMLNQKQHPEQNFRAIFALLSYARKYTGERLNQACARALQLNSPTRSTVEAILKRGLDKVPLKPAQNAAQEELDLDHHENIRGEYYYQ